MTPALVTVFLYQLTVGGALLSVVPLMILMVVLQRYWRTGLT
jgi:multiple sugar transport system permease protein